jgi:hypothetical protein
MPKNLSRASTTDEKCKAALITHQTKGNLSSTRTHRKMMHASTGYNAVTEERGPKIEETSYLDAG